jgi:hypothetical protein
VGEHTYEIGTDAALAAVLCGENVYISGPGGCVDKDTEFLSPRGWKKISEWKEGDKVLIVDKEWNAQFCNPIRYIKEPCNRMYMFKNKRLNMMISSDHRVIYTWKGVGVCKEDSVHEMSGEQLYSRFKSNATGIRARLPSAFHYEGPGIDMTEGELRLQVAVMADGRIVKEGKDNYTQMRFVKERKYKRLLWLCETFGLRYKDNGARPCSKYASGVEYEVIVWPKTEEKTYTSRYYNCSQEQLQIILEESYFWDGCVNEKCVVTTTKKETADFIQFAIHATGQLSGWKNDLRHENTCYSVRSYKRTTVGLEMDPRCEKTTIAEEVPTQDGYKYCFTVPTGMWVMRRDNKILITGNCGKTHLLQDIQSLLGESCMVVAPTGVAALNAGGVTAHRAFDLSAGVTVPEDFTEIRSKTAKPLKSKALRTLVIDEVSMVRADKFVEMDKKLQHLRKSSEPFGGLQVIMFGDFYQAQPVISTQEREDYYKYWDTDLCFYTQSWKDLNLKCVALVEQFRQESIRFATMLNCVREGRRTGDVVKELNSRCYHGGQASDAIILCSTNKRVEEINREFYDRINGEERMYKGTLKGKFPPNQLPVEDLMCLKVGMKVMIVANDLNPNHKVPCYVNGSRGTILKFYDDKVDIELDNGTLVTVPKKLWESYEYKPSLKMDWKTRKQKRVIERITTGSFEQLPLKSGYAYTIHKSQGLTLDAYNLDLGKRGAFAAGMTYVALSRAKKIQSITLLRPVRESDIIVDPRVIQFYADTFPGLDEKVRNDLEAKVKKGAENESTGECG